MTNIGLPAGKKVASVDGEKVIAELPKDGVRSLFHMLAGKPDSVQQMFHRRVLISVEDLNDLHERVKDKLKNHQVESLVPSIDMTFENNSTIEFGSWPEFRSFRWTGGEVTKEILVKWDFLVSMPSYGVPQRHLLAVKIASNMKPLDLLHSMFSRDPEEREKVVKNDCPILARVDFINHILSKELLAIVSDWSDGLRGPSVDAGIKKYIKKYSDQICYVTRKLLPALICAVIFVTSDQFFQDVVASEVVTNAQMKSGFIWFLGAGLIIVVSFEIAKFLANSIRTNIRSSNEYGVFLFTNGDRNEQNLIEKINKKFFKRFIISTVSVFSLNILAGIVVAQYWS